MSTEMIDREVGRDDRPSSWSMQSMNAKSEPTSSSTNIRTDFIDDELKVRADFINDEHLELTSSTMNKRELRLKIVMMIALIISER